MTPLISGLRPLLCFFILCIALNCGKVSSSTSEPTASQSPSADSVYLYATDFSSSGQLYSARLQNNQIQLNNLGFSLLGSSAQLKNFSGKLYLLHDSFSAVSSDNVQIISMSPLATTAQWGLLNGGNPQDLFIHNNTAYISLYNPNILDDDGLPNEDENGFPADLIALDTTTGKITKRFSFYEGLSNDGDLNGNAQALARWNNTLLVLLQDLDTGTFLSSQPGKVGRINLSTQTVDGTWVLQGRNPVDIEIDSKTDLMFLAHLSIFDPDLGTFDTADPYGGIEIFDLNTGATLNFIDDEILGGYVERLAASDDFIFAVVSLFDPLLFEFKSKIMSISRDDPSLESLRVISDWDEDVREICVQNNILWVSRRVINTKTGIANPKLYALDPDTGTPLAPPVTPIVPAVSCAISFGGDK